MGKLRPRERDDLLKAIHSVRWVSKIRIQFLRLQTSALKPFMWTRVISPK